MENKYCIYAEKFDVGLKIACALSGGLEWNEKIITNANAETYKDKMMDFKKAGYIAFNTRKGVPFNVTWGYGHMFELYAPNDYDKEDRFWNRKLPFIPSDYKLKVVEGYDSKTHKPTYKPDPRTTRQLEVVKRLFEQAECIYLATDDDREGQLIGAYLFEGLNIHKNTKRVKIQSMTAEGLLDAFTHAVPNNQMQHVEDAGRCRSIADWLVGMNLSPLNSIAYGKYTPNIKILSTGRVMTTVLAMICHREQAIKDFKVSPFWYLEGTFTTADGQTYTGKHIEKQIKEKEKADELLAKVNGKQATITSYKSEPINKAVPLLYNITALQVDANNIYGLGADEVLNIVQSLYDKGFVTYPRGDSRHLTEDMKPQVDKVLDSLAKFSEKYAKWIEQAPPKGSRNYSKRHFDNSKVESHYAIIPTTQTPDLTKLSLNQKMIYDLICRSLLRVPFSAAKCERTSITTTVEGVDFKSSGTIITALNWMIVKQHKKKADEVILPCVKKGDEVIANIIEKTGKTKPPVRYTDASLLIAMQSASKEIDDEKLKNALEEKNEGGIGRPSTRAEIINKIMRTYCYRKDKSIIPTEDAMRFIEVMKVDDLKSPEMTAEWEMKLDLVEKGKLTKQQFIDEIQSTIKNWVEIIKTDKPTMEVPEGINKGEKATKTVSSSIGVKCPLCNGDIQKGAKKYFCSNWKEKDCKFGVWTNTFGALISEEQLKKLVEDGMTDELLFTSKAGKKYKGKLKMNADGTTMVEYSNPKSDFNNLNFNNLNGII
jgi:DNA topoisomerase III